MKRDWGLMREVLLSVEAENVPNCERSWIYHLDLATQAGLVAQLDGAGLCLTMRGADFLDAIRSESSWAAIHEGIGLIGGLPSELVEQIGRSASQKA